MVSSNICRIQQLKGMLENLRGTILGPKNSVFLNFKPFFGAQDLRVTVKNHWLAVNVFFCTVFHFFGNNSSVITKHWLAFSNYSF